jgi:HAD superfamily hydrolase (TIGR01484 family)
MKNKAFIFDIDGTAVDSPAQQLPSARLREAMHAKSDEYYFCAATGRPWPFAAPVLEFLELEDPCIISGGTQICDPKTGKILQQTDIADEAVSSVMEVLFDYDRYGVVLNDFSEDEYHNGGTKPSELVIPPNVYFMDFIYLPEKVALEAITRLQKIDGITCALGVSHSPNQKDIHITNSGATKEHAIMELLGMLSVDPRNTIGAGDAGNDIHLFNAVHQKVAMANAVGELKAASDVVIGDVVDDGLATFIESL